MAVRPRVPLRKPSTGPAGFHASIPPGQGLTPAGAPASPTASADGISPSSEPITSQESRSMLQVHLCSYCGQQGNLQCQCCKMTTYCSVVCQTEDWNAHRNTCKPADPEPAKETPRDAKTLLVLGDKVGPLMSKCEASNPQRIFMRNLRMPKIMNGTDIEASVVEIYSPGRFFLLPHIPETLTNLQSMSLELEKIYKSPSVPIYIPCVGEVCAVQFSCDRNWYRGLIQTLTTDQKMARILYIDFGNEENVPVGRIKPLSANIQPFCPFAMECRIAGVVPVDGNWSETCCVAVRQLMANTTVTFTLGETVDNGRIHIVDIMISAGKQLSMFLIEQGYAAEKTIDVAPTQQEIQAMVNASLETFRRLSDGMDNNTWAEPPQPLTQAVGDSFAVVVTHLQSPGEVIVQKVENAGVIQQLQLELREHCCQVKAHQNFRPAPDTVCCAQFSEDKQWYRAKVLAYSSEERVCVGYLDFGNSEEVDLSRLLPISASLLSLPLQALPCSISGVQPIGEHWSEDCVTALQRRLSNRILWVEIQGELEGKALVAMSDKASDPQADIGELLSSAGFAAPIARSSKQQADTGQQESDPTVTTVSAPACEPLAWFYADIPCDGKTVSLHISEVKNPHEFYCYIDNPTDHQQLMELDAALNKHCKANTSAFEPKAKEPCCVMFPADGPWHRAMVEAVSEDKAVVSFVDVGHSRQVEKKFLRSITPGLLTLPFQAICCSLAGAEPLDSEWSSEAVLWFRALVVDQQLSASVLSVSGQGYNLKLETRGQDVAAALIAEQLAKAPGGGSEVKRQEKVSEDDFGQINVPISNYAGARPQETATETAATPSEAPSFPVDWDAVKLPLNNTFRPYNAAVISPSLFYLLVPNQVNPAKLQGVMTDLADYCNKASLSAAVRGRPVPGAACCAQFSADNNWYRAVVLGVGETEVSVIYADYGNIENVPISRIVPIPMHLLQLPFQITRCTLTGKENFPVVWSEEIIQIFQCLLSNDVFATVESFDGSVNVISLALQPEKGGEQITASILNEFQSRAKSTPSPSPTQKVELTDGGATCAWAAVEPEYPQAKVMSENQKEPENGTAKPTAAKNPEPARWPPEMTNAAAENPEPARWPTETTNEAAKNPEPARWPPETTNGAAKNPEPARWPPETTNGAAKNPEPARWPPETTNGAAKNPEPARWPPETTNGAAKNPEPARWPPEMTNEAAKNPEPDRWPPETTNEAAKNPEPDRWPPETMNEAAKNPEPARWPPETTNGAAKNPEPARWPPETKNGAAKNPEPARWPPEKTNEAAKNPEPARWPPETTNEAAKNPEPARWPPETKDGAAKNPEPARWPPEKTNEAAKNPEPARWPPETTNGTHAASFNGCYEDPVQKIVVQVDPPCSSPQSAESPTSGCCFLRLEAKIDLLQRLLQKQLSLTEQLLGQK
ncbi:tudor domain-containing protein 1 [Brachionichthys hirsutus]|uniref:tudor domain-containing protein 1 n=1 Tax=Brachionichthys hirsutus TaxID=412623 RepID=UPI003604431E